MNSGRQIHAVVLGMGISGCAAAELLLQQGAEVTVVDQSKDARIERIEERLVKQGARVEIQPHSLDSCQYDLGVLSPGIDPRVSLVRQLRDKKIPLIGELELAYRNTQIPMIGITGTNGKSTTTDLIALILQEGGVKTLACGNFGIPVCEAVRQGNPYDVLTVEISSFQLESIESFRPHIAVFLNITPDHMDRYESFEDYRAAKLRIFKNQTAEDFAVVNANLVVGPVRSQLITFNAYGLNADYVFDQGWLIARGQEFIHQGQTKLRGPHQAENQLAALAVADLYGVPRSVSERVLCHYQPLPHRCEWIATINGVHYINDSKATNLDSMVRAVGATQGPVILIAGGKDKGFDYRSVLSQLKGKVREAVLMGEASGPMEVAWGSEISCHRVDSLEKAVALCAQLAHRDETVLLSPGCSSYDMFRNFEHRGEVFRQLIHQLEKQK